ncbi:MAG: hypothetical protein ACRDHI_06375 [Actinomycetota bacterium]
MRQEATVLLVEADAPERERLGTALEDGGYEVITCQGPVAPDHTCIGGREGYCPLVERADVVVFDPWLPGDDAGIGTSSDRLLELYLNSGRTTVVLNRAAGSTLRPGATWSTSVNGPRPTRS